MRTSKRDPESYDPRESYAAKQLSRYDMEVAGIVVYVVTMTMFFVVALVMMLFGNEPATQARAHDAKQVIAAFSTPHPSAGHAEKTPALPQAQR
ncbi:MAG TPA: hypothetical protein VGL00_01380 [Terracidiphilus sp.]|jgi:hypothetical protein